MEQARHDPRKLAGLARIAASNRDPHRAAELAHEARQLALGDPEIVTMTQPFLSGAVPQWHFRIVRDLARNAAYEAALLRAVKPEHRVLDVGSGTGLLALLAARAGAREVISCEMNPVIAAAAQEVVARNGYQDRIRIIPKNATELDADADMGGRADILVSEIIGNTLLDERVLPVLEDCEARLLKPGARVIPSSGRIRIALARVEGLEFSRLGDVSGFDMTPFNQLWPVKRPLESGDTRVSICSEPVDLFAFDFANGSPFAPGRAEVSLVADSANANGVIQWIHLQLDDEIAYENRPAPGASFDGWSVIFHAFRPGAQIDTGNHVAVHAAHDRVDLRLWTDI